MDVLVVGPHSATGGIARYVDEQAQRLPPSVAVSVHDTSHPYGGSIDEIQALPPSVAVTTHDSSTSPGVAVVWLLLAVLKTIADALRYLVRSRPKVVHVHTSQFLSFYRTSYYVLVSKYVWRRPVVLHVHGSSFDEFVMGGSWFRDTYQRYVFDAADATIVLSEYWKDILSHHIETSKIIVLPNAVDPERYVPEESEKPHVVFVSNLIERKGVKEFEQALRRVDAELSRPITVSIAGQGPLSSTVEELAADLDYVEYYGYVEEAHKRELLCRGTVYVLPSHAEGLPIAVLEGMASENAIVTTNVGSIPEVIGEENGILVEPGDSDRLASAISELVRDSERSSTIGRTNRNEVEKRYSWDRVTEDLVDLYERCCTRSRQ